jgi:transposase
MDQIIIGVDTHKSSHIAVAINKQGARLGAMTIPSTRQRYRSLEAWATGFGPIKNSELGF